jgi:hypothetical protein
MKLSFGWLALAFGTVLLLAAASVHAQPILDQSNPTTFFTNLAARLLKSECNLEWGKIEIYPANRYTTPVHRLLQLAANPGFH